MFDLWLFRWFVVLLFHGYELVKDFIGESGGSDPLEFLKILSYQHIWYTFTNYRLSWSSHAISFSMMSCWEFSVGLKRQHIPLFFSRRRRWMCVDILEKSEKAKTWYFGFVLSSMFTSCIMFGRLGIDQPWSDPSKEEALLWRSFKHLGSQALIHLIDQGKVLIRGVVLTWSWEK